MFILGNTTPFHRKILGSLWSFILFAQFYLVPCSPCLQNSLCLCASVLLKEMLPKSLRQFVLCPSSRDNSSSRSNTKRVDNATQSQNVLIFIWLHPLQAKMGKCRLKWANLIRDIFSQFLSPSWCW